MISQLSSHRPQLCPQQDPLSHTVCLFLVVLTLLTTLSGHSIRCQEAIISLHSLAKDKNISPAAIFYFFSFPEVPEHFSLAVSVAHFSIGCLTFSSVGGSHHLHLFESFTKVQQAIIHYL